MRSLWRRNVAGRIPEEAARQAQMQGLRRRVSLLEGLLAGQPTRAVSEVAAQG